MAYKSPHFITQLLDNRRLFLEMIIAAIVLALSINIISGAVLELKWISPLLAFTVASILTLGCLLYFIKKLLWPGKHSHTFYGFFIWNKKKKRIVEVPRYDYSDDLIRYLMAAFAENAAIKKMWDKEPLGKELDFDHKAEAVSLKKNKSHQIIEEVTEYYILEKLSTHLTDYFNRPEFEKEELLVFARQDIPDVLLSNRFLELFSKPMEDRPLFEEEKDSDPTPGEVVMAFGKDGVFYSRFDLALPKGARIKRNADHAVVIDTNRFSLSIKAAFDGDATIIPWAYQRYILGEAPSDCIDYRVNVLYEVSFKFWALFSPRGWEYYRWIESFMSSFESEFSEKKHFSTIGWDAALTVIEYHERQAAQANSKRKVHKELL